MGIVRSLIRVEHLKGRPLHGVQTLDKAKIIVTNTLALVKKSKKSLFHVLTLMALAGLIVDT